MLNRTNRTLSAHLNRLNLGTRSLALRRASTSTIRPCAPAMRIASSCATDEDRRSIPSRIRLRDRRDPRIPGSPVVPPWPVASPVVRPTVGLAVPVPLDAWPVPTDRPFPSRSLAISPGRSSVTDEGPTRSPHPIRKRLDPGEISRTDGPSRLDLRRRASRRREGERRSRLKIVGSSVDAPAWNTPREPFGAIPPVSGTRLRADDARPARPRRRTAPQPSPSAAALAARHRHVRRSVSSRARRPRPIPVSGRAVGA